MNMRSLPILLLCFLPTARADDWPHAGNTQKAGEHPPSAMEQVARMTVPEGFKVTLFAAEPDIRQPVSFTFDDRGRLWVLECYTYTGKKQYDLRKRDRIVILEDTDGDGRFDERKVFWDEGQRAFGIEWGHGGVWVAQAPYLSFIPDRNYDDVPDGPVEHRVDGFTTEASHNNVNGLRWGPDGWLWGRHGMLQPSRAAVVGTPVEEREKFQACIWRYHPGRNKFEIVCTGGINPWGFDWNEVGEMFFTNNVNGQLFHLLPGARYRVNFVPPHDAEKQPFLNQCADHQHFDYGRVWNRARTGVTTDELGGGHSHCGGMIYLADNWPAHYRGKVFMHNTHGKRVNMEVLERSGSGYVARHGKDFLRANNPWYRGVELRYGPDGGVYMLDWSDHGECHDHDGVHRGSGRIYKVSFGAVKRQTGFNLRDFTDEQLVELQLFENDWWVRHARRVLEERALQGKLDEERVREDLQRIYRHPDVSRRLRAMWCLYTTQLVDTDWLQVQMRDENEHIRAWALRLMSDDGMGYGRVRIIVARMARKDPSALVRVHLAGAMQKIPIGYRLEVLVPLGKREEDRGDANLPLMIWFAAEDSIERTPELAVTLATTTVHRLTRRLVARHIASLQGRRPEILESLLEKLIRIDDQEHQRDLLDGLLDALGGGRKVTVPEGWGAAYESLGESAEEGLEEKLAELAVAFSDQEALDGFRRIASDGGIRPSQRRRALEVLVKAGAEDLDALLLQALEVEELIEVALRGLGSTGTAGGAREIISKYAEWPDTERQLALSVLSSRKQYAHNLLEAMEQGVIDRRELSAFDARRIHRAGDEALRMRIEKQWGPLLSSDTDKEAEMVRVRGLVSAAGVAAPNPRRGKVLFQQRCAACHVLWGEGGHAGPHLTGSDRRNLDYLLINIIDPNASVAPNYRLTTFTLKDGRELSGFVEEDLGSVIRLRAQEGVHHLSRDRIARRKTSEASLMPEGILRGLADAEVRDLFEYLRGKHPVRNH